MLSGHAFVGYWRNGDDHDRFRAVGDVPKSLTTRVGDLSRASSLSLVDDYAWRLAGQQYTEIKQYLRRRQLRFLEATGLCFDYSFADAVREGGANMGSPREFDSLLDIRLARLADPPVTPLPVIAIQKGPGEAS